MDGLLGYVKKYETLDITLHHIFSNLVCAYVLLSGRNGYIMVTFIFWGEITNPFFTLAELLEFRGVSSKYTTPLQVIFLVSFVFIRVFICSPDIFEV